MLIRFDKLQLTHFVVMLLMGKHIKRFADGP